MIKFRPGARTGAAPRLRLRAVAAGMAVTGILIAACGSGAAPGRAAGLGSASQGAGRTGASQGAGKTGDCNSLTTCYTPHQLRVAYGIQPLLDRGIDGRGETVVLPELASPQLSPPQVSDIRQDFARFDQPVRPARPAAAGGDHSRRAGLALAGRPGGGAGPGDGARGRPRCRHRRGPGQGDGPEQRRVTRVAAAVAAIRLGLSEGGVISISAAGQTGGEHCDTRARDSQPALGAAGSRRPPRDRRRRLRRRRRGRRAMRLDQGTDRGQPSRRSRRSTCRPRTRWCWPPAALACRPVTRPAPITARSPGACRSETRGRASRPRAAVSATGSPGPVTPMACPASALPGACPMWPPTLPVTPAWPWPSATAAASSPSAIAAAPVPPLRSGPG